MKAHYFTANERKAMSAVMKEKIEEQLDDVCKRTQYLWMMAMLNAGLSPRTIHRVQKELMTVCNAYGVLKEDGVADYAIWKKLTDAGVHVGFVEKEQ